MIKLKKFDAIDKIQHVSNAVNAPKSKESDDDDDIDDLEKDTRNASIVQCFSNFEIDFQWHSDVSSKTIRCSQLPVFKKCVDIVIFNHYHTVMFFLAVRMDYVRSRKIF